MIADADVRAAKALLAAHRRQQRLGRDKSTKGRVRDPGFMGWLHDGLPCVACVINGHSQRFGELYPIEAAHQKFKGPALGRKSDDADACPLCAWHHRLAPNACDPAQRKFWDRLGVDVAAFCRALFAAYQSGGDGAAIVRQFAREAKRG